MTQETGAGEVIMINIGLPIMMIMPIITVGRGRPRAGPSRRRRT